MEVFRARVRTDRAPQRPNESKYAFYDRTGSRFFDPVRELLQRWVVEFPHSGRAGVVGSLRSGDNHAFDSAFWELYLHNLLVGSGYEVEVHPDVDGTAKHPDFLVHAPEPFYLEAVKVGRSPTKTSSDRRLAAVEAILESTRVDGWTLSFNWDRVGPQPVKATRLRSDLVAWSKALGNSDEYDLSGPLPVHSFDEDGWELEFRALPVGDDVEAPLVLMRGPGRAFGVDNVTGLRRVLEKKAGRYGRDLRYPLVTAVLSNTEVPTKLYEVQPTLFGDHWLGPAHVADFKELRSDGHWRTKSGWRRSHNPYVVVGRQLELQTMHKAVPWVWRTLDPTVNADLHLPWAAPIDVNADRPEATPTAVDLDALGIDADWYSGDPDFTQR